MNLWRKVFDRRKASIGAPEERRRLTSREVDARLLAAIENLERTAVGRLETKKRFTVFSERCEHRYVNGSAVPRCTYGADKTLMICSEHFCPIFEKDKR